MVLCLIFGVLSCTVWEGTTAGTVVLTIAIILYVIDVFTTLSAPHFSTATATASLYLLSAWYCSALPPR